MRAVAALSATVFVAISLALAGIALVVLQDRAVRALIEHQVRAHAVSVAARLAAGVTPAAMVATGGSGFEVLQVLNGTVNFSWLGRLDDGGPWLLRRHMRGSGIRWRSSATASGSTTGFPSRFGMSAS